MTIANALVHRNKYVTKFQPRDINAAAQGGNYNFTSFRLHEGAGILILVGAKAGNAVGITLRQARNVEGSGSKALEFTEYYSNLPGGSPQETEDLWRKQTASGDTFDIVANTNYFIPLRQAMLDVTNNFDCFRLEVEAASSATLIAVLYELYGGPEGIDDDTLHIPSVAVNRMPN